MNNKILAVVIVAIVAVAGIAGALLLTGGLTGKVAEQDEEDDLVAVFEVVSISSNRDVMLVGDEFQVTAQVKNTGTGDGNYTANLTVDEELISSKKVSVKAGEIKTILFDLVAEAAVSATMKLGNLTANVTIYEPVALGDYRVYHMEGYDADLGQAIDQILNYTVIAMDDRTYTTRITYDGSSEAPTEVVSFLGVQWSTGRPDLVLTGAEGANTYLGAMTLNHYTQVADGLTYEYWVHFRGNVMIKTTVTNGASTITQTLIDTNCLWLAEI